MTTIGLETAKQRVRQAFVKLVRLEIKDSQFLIAARLITTFDSDGEVAYAGFTVLSKHFCTPHLPGRPSSTAWAKLAHPKFRSRTTLVSYIAACAILIGAPSNPVMWTQLRAYLVYLGSKAHVEEHDAVAFLERTIADEARPLIVMEGDEDSRDLNTLPNNLLTELCSACLRSTDLLRRSNREGTFTLFRTPTWASMQALYCIPAEERTAEL